MQAALAYRSQTSKQCYNDSTTSHIIRINLHSSRERERELELKNFILQGESERKKETQKKRDTETSQGKLWRNKNQDQRKVIPKQVASDTNKTSAGRP